MTGRDAQRLRDAERRAKLTELDAIAAAVDSAEAKHGRHPDIDAVRRDVARIRATVLAGDVPVRLH